MKNTDFFEAMGHLDDCILEAADAAISKKVKFNIRTWMKWGGMAACFCVMAIGIILIARYPSSVPSVPTPTMPAYEQIVGIEDVSPKTEFDEDVSYRHTIEGIEVSEGLYIALNENMIGNLCINVIVEQENADDVVSQFMSNGIYAEKIDEKIYIFPTKTEFIALQLSEEQKASWYFELSSKAHVKND